MSEIKLGSKVSINDSYGFKGEVVRFWQAWPRGKMIDVKSSRGTVVGVQIARAVLIENEGDES